MVSNLRPKALEVHRLLVESYGEQLNRPRLKPIAELVCTILSQNTNDANRDVAFDRLRERFPGWEEVRDAPVEEIEAVIRPAGLGRQKAPAIKRALQRITEERGEISLEFLEEMPLEDARRWLTQLKGVGPKTAAIVLLFAFDRPAFPVDTHVHRISKRLGLIGPKVSREKAHVLLEEIVPPDLYYTLHLNLLAHGRQICLARNPRCAQCTLARLCDYYQSHR